jgi:hypothetical protein
LQIGLDDPYHFLEIIESAWIVSKMPSQAVAPARATAVGRINDYTLSPKCIGRLAEPGRVTRYSMDEDDGSPGRSSRCPPQTVELYSITRSNNSALGIAHPRPFRRSVSTHVGVGRTPAIDFPDPGRAIELQANGNQA